MHVYLRACLGGADTFERGYALSPAAKTARDRVATHVFSVRSHGPRSGTSASQGENSLVGFGGKSYLKKEKDYKKKKKRKVRNQQQKRKFKIWSSLVRAAREQGNCATLASPRPRLGQRGQFTSGCERPKLGAKRPLGFSSFFPEHGAPGAGQCSRGGGLPGPPGNRPARARGLSPSLRQSISRRHICHRCRHSVEPHGVGCRAVLGN